MKPEGYENIVSRTLRDLDFTVHPGLCGKCGNALWWLERMDGTSIDPDSYAVNPDSTRSLFCKCLARNGSVRGMILDCDAYKRAEDRTQGVPKGDLPSSEYYFGEEK